MSSSINPYESPQSDSPPETWLARLRRLFRIFQTSPSAVFAHGGALICEGIAFFVDPADPLVAYAASPSTDYSSRRMNLIVSEAIRILPSFLADYPELHGQLRGRKLTVRMVDSYAGARSKYSREVPLEWDILDAILSDGFEYNTDE